MMTMVLFLLSVGASVFGFYCRSRINWWRQYALDEQKKRVQAEADKKSAEDCTKVLEHVLLERDKRIACLEKEISTLKFKIGAV